MHFRWAVRHLNTGELTHIQTLCQEQAVRLRNPHLGVVQMNCHAHASLVSGICKVQGHFWCHSTRSGAVKWWAQQSHRVYSSSILAGMAERTTASRPSTPNSLPTSTIQSMGDSSCRWTCLGHEPGLTTRGMLQHGNETCDNIAVPGHKHACQRGVGPHAQCRCVSNSALWAPMHVCKYCTVQCSMGV